MAPHRASILLGVSIMFGIRYLKLPATTFVLLYRNGKVVRSGKGLSFFYFAPTSVLVRVPVKSVDMPFAFTETTADTSR
jgi:hypothetical protein